MMLTRIATTLASRCAQPFNGAQHSIMAAKTACRVTVNDDGRDSPPSHEGGFATHEELKQYMDVVRSDACGHTHKRYGDVARDVAKKMLDPGAAAAETSQGRRAPGHSGSVVTFDCGPPGATAPAAASSQAAKKPNSSDGDDWKAEVVSHLRDMSGALFSTTERIAQLERSVEAVVEQNNDDDIDMAIETRFPSANPRLSAAWSAVRSERSARRRSSVSSDSVADFHVGFPTSGSMEC